MSGECLVVGAGAAGLAVGAELGRHGVPYRVLEAGDCVGSAWRSRYDSLRLHTVRWLSGLPGAPIHRRYGSWVSRDDLVAYLDAYARRFGVPIDLGVEVTRVEPVDHGWDVSTSAGLRHASAVVFATGYSHTPYLPDWPGLAGFGGQVLHSAQYRHPGPYAGWHVVVVGAGNSAAEIAVELSEAGAEVDLAVRTPPNIVRRAVLGVPSQLLGVALKRAPERLMNPLSAALRRVSVPDLSEQGLPSSPADGFTQFLRTRTTPILDHGFVAAVRDQRVRIVSSVDHFDEDAVVLDDGQRVPADLLVAATGYRPGLEPLVGHLDVLNPAGIPKVHGARTLPQAPGLYFVGITVELAGLLREIGLEARAVGRAVADHRLAG